MAARKKAKARPRRKAAVKSKAKSKPKRKAAPARKAKPKTPPAGYRVVTPAFRVPGCGRAITFLQEAFGAKVVQRYDGPGGTVAHCELRIGDSLIMCGDCEPDQIWHLSAMIYVKDCDATFQRALAAGATAKEPPADQFYGDRNGRVLDPFGNEWVVATHKEDVSKKEMAKRMAALMGGG
jgi:PhnB protein